MRGRAGLAGRGSRRRLGVDGSLSSARLSTDAIDCGALMRVSPTHTRAYTHTRAHTRTRAFPTHPTPALTTLEYAGIDLPRWLAGFHNVDDSVANSVAVIRNHPLLPPGLPVHGLIMDPHTGALEVLVDGSNPERAAAVKLVMP